MFEFFIFIILPLIISLICYFIKNLRTQYSISLVLGILHLGLAFCIFLGFDHANLPFLFGIDSLSKLWILILSNVYFWVVLVSYSYLKRPVNLKAEDGKQYYFLFL